MSATAVVASVPYIHQEYPKMLYRAGSQPRVVKDQLAHLSLCNEEDGWTDSPSPRPLAGPAPTPFAPSNSAVELELATLRAENARLKLLQTAAPPSQPVPPPTLVEAVAEAIVVAATAEVVSEQEALYATPVSVLISKLRGSSLPVLEKLKAYELANPRPEGPRKSLLEAVAIAMKGLL